MRSFSDENSSIRHQAYIDTLDGLNRLRSIESTIENASSYSGIVSLDYP